MTIKKDHCGGVDDDEEVVVDIQECSSVDDKIEIEVSEECNDDDDTNDVFCSSSSPFSGTVSLVHDETEQTASNGQEADSIMCTSTDPASLLFFVR